MEVPVMGSEEQQERMGCWWRLGAPLSSQDGQGFSVISGLEKAAFTSLT